MERPPAEEEAAAAAVAGYAAAGYAAQPSFGSSSEEKKDEFEPPPPSSYASAPPLAKKPPPPSPTRKSDRKRTSTTILVNGHVIKRDNNYTVTGMTYVHGAFASDDTTNANKKPKTSKAVVGGVGGLPKKQKARPPHETARLSHNAMLRQKMTIDESNRLLFMKRHVDVLEPFLDAKVKLLLKSDQGNANQNNQVEKMVAPEEKILLASQPDIVTTELRDYQMVGLEWMVGMHSKGVPFILGDEMGLGELYIALFVCYCWMCCFVVYCLGNCL